VIFIKIYSLFGLFIINSHLKCAQCRGYSREHDKVPVPLELAFWTINEEENKMNMDGDMDMERR
jgi:hypothetical protein